MTESPAEAPAGSLTASLIVPGDPVPWAAARQGSNGGRFVPARQSGAVSRIIEAWQRSGQAKFDVDARLRLSCAFFVGRPKYHYGTGKNADIIKPRFVDAQPTGKPDLTNLVKLAEDALTNYAFMDDDQVVELHGYKWFTTARDDPPRTCLTITTI